MFVRTILEFLYRKLGRRYPRLILWLQVHTAALVVAGGIGLLSVYVEMSTDELLQLLIAGELILLIENVWAFRFGSRILRPADPWLRGERNPRTTAAAWEALAGLPREFLRHWTIRQALFNSVPFCITALIVLDLHWWAILFLLAGGGVVLLYATTLRFFLLELAMRPVLVEVGRDLPEEHPLGRGISLRTRLLLGLPILNVITGVIVAGLSTDDRQTLADLGLDVFVAVLVAGTVALELTLLLVRSIVWPIRELTDATEHVARGDYSIRVPVMTTDETGVLAQSFNRMVDGLEERRKLFEAFAAFVDPALAERVLQEGPLLEGEEVEVTLFFLDIRGFTALAERSSAREVVDQLNDLYGLVVPIIADHGGHANTYVGDGLLAVFGVPRRLPDHADRALRAALEVAAAVNDRYRGDLRIGIGINSGPVVAGTIGGGGHVEFTVIGDAVNTAARVEEVTRVSGDDILITEATRALLSDPPPVTVERRPDAPLKGKTERVNLYAPVTKEQPRRARDAEPAQTSAD